MKNLAVAAALVLVGCGGYEYEPSPLSKMDVVGVWKAVYGMDEAPSLFPVDEPIHDHSFSLAYITLQVTVEEMAHALTHVYMVRKAVELQREDLIDGDFNHLQSIWAQNNEGDHVLERAAAKWLRENPGR